MTEMRSRYSLRMLPIAFLLASALSAQGYAQTSVGNHDCPGDRCSISRLGQTYWYSGDIWGQYINSSTGETYEGPAHVYTSDDGDEIWEPADGDGPDGWAGGGSSSDDFLGNPYDGPEEGQDPSVMFGNPYDDADEGYGDSDWGNGGGGAWGPPEFEPPDVDPDWDPEAEDPGIGGDFGDIGDIEPGAPEDGWGSGYSFQTEASSPQGHRVRETYSYVQDSVSYARAQEMPNVDDMERVATGAVVAADELYAAGKDAEGDIALTMAKTVADIGLGLIPGVGWGKDVYEAVSGKSLIDGSELSTFDRTFAVVGVLTAGVGSKIGAAVSGFGLLGTVISKTAKTAGELDEAVEVLGSASDLMRAADRIGLKEAADIQDFGRLADIVGKSPSKAADDVLAVRNSGARFFPNQLPGRLATELEDVARVGAKPITGPGPALNAAIDEGTIKYVVAETGDLIMSPKHISGVEIPHATLSGGRPVISAGEAEIARAGDVFFGTAINNHSGHFRPSEDTVDIARDAFSAIGITFP